jgi:prepilin-type N-terminal cleavage/methylation domain-containing protein
MKLALSSLPRSAPRRSGFTLLEVALALAIFLIGALAIIRIFPGGLAVVAQSENQLRASDINKAVLARINSSQSAPRSIFYGDISTAAANAVAPTWRNFNGAVLGPTRQNASLPLSSDLGAYYKSALPKLITIHGEPVQVQINNKGTLNDATDDTTYLVTQFPIAFNRDAVDGSGISNNPIANVFEEDEMEGVQITATGKFDFSKATFKSSGVPVTTTANTGCTATTCVMYATYRYKNPTNLSGVTDEPIAWTGNIAADVYAPHYGTNSVVGNVSMRLRHLLGATPITRDEAHLGYIPTIPGTAFMRDKTRVGTPLTVDYQAGWGSYSLVQDIPSLTPQSQYVDTTDPTNPGAPNATPAPGEAQIALNAPYTFVRGTLPLCALITYNGGLTSAIFDGVTTPPANTFLLKTDGEINTLGTSSPEQAAIAANERRYSLRTGRISFDMENPYKPKQVRLAYATRDNWTQQLTTASSSYMPFDSASTPTFREEWREYFLSTDNDLYFHATEAGKTVEVTYTTASSTTPVTTVGTIEQRLINPTTPAALVTFAGNEYLSNPTVTSRVARLVIYDNNGAKANPTNILDVRGLSVSMRTAWLDRDAWQQNVTTTLRRESQ